jgi:Arc/MetJ-type ribon-helix-helix transcriptional regulator
MKAKKERVTVTVDRSLLAAANAAIAAGRSASLSAWVNEALVERAAKERRLAVLAQLVKDYEKDHGTITDAEIAAQVREDRRGAIVVRGRGARRSRKRGAA